LPAGERPRDWVNDGFEGVASGESLRARREATRPGGESPGAGGEAIGVGAGEPSRPGGDASRAGGEAIGVSDEMLPDHREALPVGPVPADLPPVTGPQLYHMQFSTVEEHVQLIERAKALLARERPSATLGELHLEAMKMLVAALEKRKFAVTERPRQPSTKPAHFEQREPSEAPCRRGVAVVDRLSKLGSGELIELRAKIEIPSEALAVLSQRESSDPPRQRVAATVDRREPSEPPRQRVNVDARQSSEPPRQRGRYIPAAERREVYRRDCGRCSYVDARGERCCETRYLELHHLRPFARQGLHITSNLALRCRAHNRLAAEQDFGPQLMAEKCDSLRHDALGAQIDAITKR
jgi:5-methylcytosine-specific restriction endonuclease McrA